MRRNAPDIVPDFSTPETFAEGVNELMPYFSGLAINSISLGMLKRLSIRAVRDASYREFEIPKKSGGMRRIVAPSGLLKATQRCIAHMLGYVYFVPETTMGFVAERSVKTNAEKHVGRRYVLNTDLSDFFTSIGISQVRRALTCHGIPGEVANLIAALCCRTGEDGRQCLPQGAPTSPVLSNIVCTGMDVRLFGLSRRFGLTYTRYADDITFSSDHSVYGKDGEFWKEFRNIISQTGFSFNPKKTRLQTRKVRQEVTGLTVGDKVNVSRKYLKNLRAQLHNMLLCGTTEAELKSVSGKINFVAMVRGKDDHRVLRLRSDWTMARFQASKTEDRV